MYQLHKLFLVLYIQAGISTTEKNSQFYTHKNYDVRITLFVFTLGLLFIPGPSQRLRKLILLLTSSPPGRLTEDNIRTESSLENVSTFHLLWPTYIKYNKIIIISICQRGEYHSTRTLIGSSDAGYPVLSTSGCSSVMACAYSSHF